MVLAVAFCSAGCARGCARCSGGAARAAGAQFTCFTGTKVRILTQLRQLNARDAAARHAQIVRQLTEMLGEAAPVCRKRDLHSLTVPQLLELYALAGPMHRAGRAAGGHALGGGGRWRARGVEAVQEQDAHDRRSQVGAGGGGGGGGGGGAGARVGVAEARGVLWAWLASGAQAAAAAHAAARQKDGGEDKRRSQVAEAVGRLQLGGGAGACRAGGGEGVDVVAARVGRLQALLSPTRVPRESSACAGDATARVAAVALAATVRRPAMPALAERVARLQAFLAQVMNYLLKILIKLCVINELISEGK